jgi:hypothetical protein
MGGTKIAKVPCIPDPATRLKGFPTREQRFFPTDFNRTKGV